MYWGTDLGAGLLLYRCTLAPGASINRFWAVTRPLPLLEAPPALLIVALGPLTPLAPAARNWKMRNEK